MANVLLANWQVKHTFQRTKKVWNTWYVQEVMRHILFLRGYPSQNVPTTWNVRWRALGTQCTARQLAPSSRSVRVHNRVNHNLEVSSKFWWDESLEQQCAIKFCVKVGKIPGNTYRTIQWAFGRDSLTKSGSDRWHKDAPHLVMMTLWLIVFFYVKSVVNSEFVQPGHCHCKYVRERLKQRIYCVRSEIKNSRKLHHDNASSHTTFLVRDYLTQIGVATALQPPYSDLVPIDFLWFQS